MPASNLENVVEPQVIYKLSVGTQITVNQVDQKQIGQSPWYFVETITPDKELIGTGWINSIALVGQYPSITDEQLQRQSELQRQLKKQYQAELAIANKLSVEQMQEIILEGLQNDWALPRTKYFAGLSQL